MSNNPGDSQTGNSISMSISEGKRLVKCEFKIKTGVCDTSLKAAIELLSFVLPEKQF